VSAPQTTVVTRYETRVHAKNRHAGLGIPVTVYADSKQDAVDRAIAVGWNGHVSDARVTVDKVAQEVVVLAPGRGEEREEQGR
jgi:hypothetical protein